MQTKEGLLTKGNRIIGVPRHLSRSSLFRGVASPTLLPDFLASFPSLVWVTRAPSSDSKAIVFLPGQMGVVNDSNIISL